MIKNNEGKGNAVASGIAGAVIGAGVAAAATKVLSDKKTQAKVKKTLSGMRKQVVNTVNKVKDNAEVMGDRLTAKTEEGEISKKKAPPARKRGNVVSVEE